MLNEIGLSGKGPFAWSLDLWNARSPTAGMLNSIMCMASGVQYPSEEFSLTLIRVICIASFAIGAGFSVPDISFLRLNLSIDCVDVELSCFWRWLSWAYVCSIALSESEEDKACRANSNDNHQIL